MQTDAKRIAEQEAALEAAIAAADAKLRLRKLRASRIAGWVTTALLLGFALVWGMVPAAGASEIRWPGPHAVEILAVRDGDTVLVRFRDGPCGRGPCPGAVLSIRVRGIDTPETRLCGTRVSQSCAACEAERLAGEKAKAFAKDLLKGEIAARVRDIGPDPYAGRVVARLEILRGGWQDFGSLMMQAGHAEPYEPEAAGTYRKSKPWCPSDQPEAR